MASKRFLTLTREPKSGMSFYATGTSNMDLAIAKEVSFGYDDMGYFEEGFEWKK